MHNPVLQVDKLNTAFSVDGEWLNVVRDLSFSIGPKETLALVGESGSGKSVTAMSVMRLLDENRPVIPAASGLTARIYSA